jgi:hypothetical protein
MKKTIVLVTLAIAFPVFAGWTRFDSNDKATRYIDVDSVVRSPPLLRVWSFLDFERPLGSDRSMRLLYEINCKEMKLRVLSVEGFTGQMLAGDVSRGPGWNKPGEWEYIAPGSASENLFKYNCK